MNKTISKKELKQFGFLIGFGVPILFGLILPLIHGYIFANWTLWIGIPFLLLTFIRPYLLLLPFKIWMKIGHVLGWVNSRIILGIVFILVLQPIALIMRFFKYDPLRKKKCENNSYRENKKGYKVDLTKIF